MLLIQSVNQLSSPSIAVPIFILIECRRRHLEPHLLSQWYATLPTVNHTILLCTYVTTIDPLFFLLHCQLDRLWAAWQNASPVNFRAIGGGETQNLTVYAQYRTGTTPWVTEDTIIHLSNLGPDTPIKDLFDTRGAALCYEYDTFE